MTNYRRLSVAEREAINNGFILGKGNNQTAYELGRSPSTISREVKRMGLTREQYSVVLADDHSKCNQSSRNKGRRKIGSELGALIEEYLIVKRFSPEQISHHLRRTFPEKAHLHISHEAIYQYIYQQKKSEKRRQLINCLRRRKKHRRRRKCNNEKRGKIPNAVSIHERPEAVNRREEFGHWEGDLIIGKQHQTALLTIVERVSRYTLIVHLGSNMTSEAVVRACEQRLVAFPEELRKSLTYDRGHEMSLHQQLTQVLGINVYFADPHSPWQRGTNENTNGLIRDFFPKGTDFSQCTIEDVQTVETLLNTRPRKILNFATPREIIRNNFNLG